MHSKNSVRKPTMSTGMCTAFHLTVNMGLCICFCSQIFFKGLQVTDSTGSSTKSKGTWLPSGHQHWLWSPARVSGQNSHCGGSLGHQLPIPGLLRIPLTGHLERVNLFPLFGQGLVHAAQVVAHHAQLILVAPLGGHQLVLKPADVLTG